MTVDFSECRHDALAIPLIHSGNEAIVDEMVREGKDASGYVYFGCPICRTNLEGVKHEPDSDCVR